MSGFEVTRRGFLMGCSSAIAAMAGARFNSVVFADSDNSDKPETLITIFLRGGIDVLSLMPPLAGDDRGYYEAARPTLKIPTAELAQLGSSNFGLHPSAAALTDLYATGQLALVPGAGMHYDTRSHFDAMTFMELGTPGVQTTETGWITRFLETQTISPDAALPALSADYYPPTSLRNSTEALSMHTPSEFNLNTGPYFWQNAQRYALRQMYGRHTSFVHEHGLRALDAVDLIEAKVQETYTPEAGVTYPDGTFGEHLQIVAQMIKLELGLTSATVDLGGWDTHEQQGSGSAGYFSDLLTEFSQGLAAFYADLNTSQSDFTRQVTIVIKSEFGRRIDENGDSGTDHGHGGVMMVLGGNVNGGVHGTWPTLAPAARYQGIDLAVTTDYRQILSEIMIRRMKNANLGYVFPGYSGYAPLGIVQGDDMDPIWHGGTPTAVSLHSAEANTATGSKAAVAAAAGLAATASLVALRNREA